MAADKHRLPAPPRVPTSVSAAFRAGSDPKELRNALTDLARHAEASVLVLETHWQRIGELGENLESANDNLTREIERIEGNTLSLAAKQTKLELRIQRIEVKIAMWSALGAAFGGVITAVLMKVVFR